MLIHYMRKQRDNKCMGTGAYGETQKGEGQTNGGEGRILRKINSFCEILNKMSQRGGGEGPLRFKLVAKEGLLRHRF